MSSLKLSPWEMQAQLWKRELTPSTPFLFHKEYKEADGNDEQSAADISAALSGHVSPGRIHSQSVQQARADSTLQAALQGRNLETRRSSRRGGSSSRGGSPHTATIRAESTNAGPTTPLAVGAAAVASAAAAAAANDEPATAMPTYDDHLVHLGGDRAMHVEAGAVVDELSPDRGSFKSQRRRADFLRADAEAQKLGIAAAASADGASPSPAMSAGGRAGFGGGGAASPAAAALSGGHRHGLEGVKCPYRLHSIVSQKDLHKRRRVDLHATSSSMLGRGRVTHNMSDVDVAAYVPDDRQLLSMKQDRPPELLLADTVIAARGGLTPEERLHKQVGRFIERLVNAAEREEENQIRPRTKQQWRSEAEVNETYASAHGGGGGSSPATPGTPGKKQQQQLFSFYGEEKRTATQFGLFSPDRLQHGSGFLHGSKTPPAAQRRPGFAQRLLEEQRSHVVDAMAHMLLARASPERAAADLAQQQQQEQQSARQRVTVRNAVSFALSADDKHILLTAVQFALSDELFRDAAEFHRVTGFTVAEGRKVLKQLGATFDHWNKVCYDLGGEWALLKRCLAAVTETPVNWAARPHTARSVHFGTVSQRDLESLLDRLRNDEIKKVRAPVSERHKGKIM